MSQLRGWGSWCAILMVVVGSLSTAVYAEANDPFGMAEEQGLPERAAEALADADVARCVCAGDNAATDRIRRVLAGPVPPAGFDFVDTPLEEVTSLLQQDFDIPIQLDTRALADMGIGPDEPVTVTLRNISLRSALRLILRHHQLTYVIRNEVLLITTPDEAENELRVCVYAVGDLVKGRKDTEGMDALIAAIVACAAHETWAANGGGEAEIRSLPAGLLVVSQTDAVHEEIGDLLHAIRRAGKQP